MQRLYYFCIVKILASIIFSIKKYYYYYIFEDNIDEYYIYNILNNYYINNESIIGIIDSIYNKYCLFDNKWVDILKKLKYMMKYSVELQVDFLIHLQHKNGCMFDESYDQLYTIPITDIILIEKFLESKIFSL